MAKNFCTRNCGDEASWGASAAVAADTADGFSGFRLATETTTLNFTENWGSWCQFWVTWGWYSVHLNALHRTKQRDGSSEKLSICCVLRFGVCRCCGFTKDFVSPFRFF